MAITLTVDGNNVYILDDWVINKKLNARSTLDFTISDLDEASSINIGDTVIMSDGASVIFAGLIKSINKYDPFETNETIYYKINTTDYSALADKRLIAQVVESSTVANTITNYILPILAEESVNEGTIEANMTIDRAVFKYITCAQALDQLKDILTNYVWYIWYDSTEFLESDRRKLNFHPKTYVSGPDLDQNVDHTNFDHEQHMDVYRNKQYLRGGKARTGVQTKEVLSPLADGNTRTFVARFPVAEKPTIYINSGGGDVAVSASDVGVNGIDADGTKKWYFGYNSQTITQDSNETVLAAGVIVKLTYIGLREVFVVTDSPVEIANRDAIEAFTSGIYEQISEDVTIEDTNQARDIANGMLSKYGEVADKITFETTENIFEIGQSIRVNKTLYGIDEYYLIDNIYINQWGPDGTVLYKIEAVDSPSIGNWESYFAAIINSGRKFTINDSEVLITIVSWTEHEDWSSSYEVSEHDDSLKVSETTYVSETTLLGGVRTGVFTYED